MTTAVFFDVDGTLVQFDRPYADILRAAARRCGVEPTDGFVEAYDETFFERFDAFAEHPYRDAAAAALDVVGDAPSAGRTDCDPAELAAAVVETEFEATEVTAGVRDLLD